MKHNVIDFESRKKAIAATGFDLKDSIFDPYVPDLPTPKGAPMKIKLKEQLTLIVGRMIAYAWIIFFLTIPIWLFAKMWKEIFN